MRTRLLKKRLKSLFSPKLIMTYFIVFLMLGSVLGFVLMDTMNTQSPVSFNNHKVELDENGYLVTYENEKLDFIFSPFDLEFVELPENAINLVANSTYVILSFDPRIASVGDMDYIHYIMYEYLLKENILVGRGMASEDIRFDYPIVSCANSTIESPVILFEEGTANNATVNSDNGCIKVISDNSGFRVRFAERLIYGVLGIIE
ncbi:MAG: hypothetical protein ACOCUR_00160 [Nanoarchaeota archaeon]